tara:strand:- start:435 stop:557 length:123 start_codon:yes stop_codon:yes gene_type:complete
MFFKKKRFKVHLRTEPFLEQAGLYPKNKKSLNEDLKPKIT